VEDDMRDMSRRNVTVILGDWNDKVMFDNTGYHRTGRPHSFLEGVIFKPKLIVCE